ncbi:MAG: phosphodiester glycosidase family protein [Christensenellales bacterium]|jgi:hypothetical protein
MKTPPKRSVLLVAILLMTVFLSFVSIAMEDTGNIIIIPIEEKIGLAPHAEGYLSDRAYQDPSISVRIWTGREFDTNLMVAHVKLANASQIRTEMASSYRSTNMALGATIAKRVNAVLAINGDYFSAKNNVGYVARQGTVYRTRCDGRHDVLIIDENGDLHILQAATNEDVENIDYTPINGFTFGPGLIVNGEKQGDFPDLKNAPCVPAQRMCLAQVGPLEYLCISSEGPEDPGSVGFTLEQFAEVVYNLGNTSHEGVEIGPILNAYNLDGGSSATMVFQNKKINAPNNPKKRPLNDIVWFGTAYQPEEKPQEEK